MTKFLVLWRRNMLAPWRTDRREIAENMEAMFDATERYMDAGMVTENGLFADGDSGSFIFEGDVRRRPQNDELLQPFNTI